ncbi:hypothetical protein HELRODRAFT_95235, partial [Helobdella robusta]|uniref:EGF-like domain-containing protein n=1 Tax=Helobdella robusta TaxID=6412 RepID=T1G952_HELRO
TIPTACDTAVSTCVDKSSYYVCDCISGYQHPPNNDTYCADVDECFESQHNCSKPLATCLNTKGSFVCICPYGYVQVNNNCLEEDECTTYANACDNRTSTCVNKVGTYSCNCLSGFYSKNPWTCDDIDECALNLHNCSNPTEICVNTAGSFVCQCSPGYQRFNNVCSVSGERNLLFAFIGVFGAVILTLIGVFASCAASYQSQLAKANLSE